jgi:hypothetical protein
MSNLSMSWGKKQLWFIIPVMILGFLPMMKLFFFRGDATKELVITDVQNHPSGQQLEILGLITNKGNHTWTGINVEAEFYDGSGNFIDEASDYLRSNVGKGAKEHFKISFRAANPQVSAPETKMVVKIAGGHTDPF